MNFSLLVTAVGVSVGEVEEKTIALGLSQGSEKSFSFEMTLTFERVS